MLYVVGGCGCSIQTDYVGEVACDMPLLINYVTAVTIVTKTLLSVLCACILHVFMRNILQTIDLDRQRSQCFHFLTVRKGGEVA